MANYFDRVHQNAFLDRVAKLSLFDSHSKVKRNLRSLNTTPDFDKRRFTISEEETMTKLTSSVNLTHRLRRITGESQQLTATRCDDLVNRSRR